MTDLHTLMTGLSLVESAANRFTAFDIAAGRLANRRVWADVGSDHPDSICLDAEGAVGRHYLSWIDHG